MLPGQRQFTDEDVLSVLGEAYQAFRQVVEKHDVPEVLHPVLFGHAVNMVGQRELVVPGDLLTQGKLLGPKQ